MNERVFLPHKKKKLTSFQIIILGFLGVILLGTVFHPCGNSNAVCGCFVYIHLGCLRHRTCPA